MPTFNNCKAIRSDIAFAMPANSDVQVNGCEAEDCKTAFLVYGSEEELKSILSIIKDHPKEVEELQKKIASLKNPLHVDKEVMIRSSSLFTILSSSASAATIIDFLIKYLAS